RRLHGSAAAAQEVSGAAVRPRCDGARTALPESGRTPTADSRQQAAGSRQQAAGSRQQAAGIRLRARGPKKGGAVLPGDEPATRAVANERP
ncbi:hypothetical protein OIV70_27655, partial [Burkholderia pseudomallei]|uniref:hypothetical protein n=1 Tax=Burkholderia pseudomallei TaxID=28450 RepID=UPI00299F6873